MAPAFDCRKDLLNWSDFQPYRGNRGGHRPNITAEPTRYFWNTSTSSPCSLTMTAIFAIRSSVQSIVQMLNAGSKGAQVPAWRHGKFCVGKNYDKRASSLHAVTRVSQSHTSPKLIWLEWARPLVSVNSSIFCVILNVPAALLFVDGWSWLVVVPHNPTHPVRGDPN